MSGASGYGTKDGGGDGLYYTGGHNVTSTGAPAATNTANNTPNYTPSMYGAGAWTPPSFAMTPQAGYTGQSQQLTQALQLSPQPYAAPRTGLTDMFASPWSVLYGGPAQPTFAQMYGQDPMQGRTLPPGVAGAPGTTVNTPPPSPPPPAPPQQPTYPGGPNTSAPGSYGPGGAPPPGAAPTGGMTPGTGPQRPTNTAPGNKMGLGGTDMLSMFSGGNDATRMAMLSDIPLSAANQLARQYGAQTGMSEQDVLNRWGKGNQTPEALAQQGSTYQTGMFGEQFSKLAPWAPGGSRYKAPTPGWSMPPPFPDVGNGPPPVYGPRPGAGTGSGRRGRG